MNRQPEPPSVVTVAVLGNPNVGKSTLFNALTGVRQQTGNFPGVTVERRTGQMKIGNDTFVMIDLPGNYSLAPASPDEMLTVNVLTGQQPGTDRPDLILCVVDANNLERNLFLVSQLLDLNLPTVIAMNMVDVAKRHRVDVDLEKLTELLSVPVIAVQANRNRGIDELKKALGTTSRNQQQSKHTPFEPNIEQHLSRLEKGCPDSVSSKRFAVTRLLFDVDGFMTSQFRSQVGEPLIEKVDQARQQLQRGNREFAEIEAQSRYRWITRNLASIIKQPAAASTKSMTDRIDAWLTHPFWGLIVAVLIMVLVFQLIFWAAEPASAMIDSLNGILASVVNQFIPEGAFNSLLVDGLINGVGSVLIFLPQILLLFLVLGVLEDSGYLARAAFLMDRYLSRLGLSGITMFPLLSSFACAIPGIMATRVIKNERERLTTILIAPLMSCSARLPVYVLLIAAFVPEQSFLGGFLGVRGLTMFAMYAVGILAAIVVAWILRKTILKFGSSSFVLELPSYKFPGIQNIFRRMFDGGWAFVRDAGTMIVVVTIIVWAAAYFPRISAESLPPALVADHATVEAEDSQSEEFALAQNRLDAYQLENSILGRAGKLIEPIVRPLGWDWRIGSAAIAAFPAREVMVSTLGVIFGLGADTDEESKSLRDSLKAAKWPDTDIPLITLPVALSIMVFFALCAQCVSTLAVIRRETNSYRWPLFTFVYMTVLAYAGAWITYNVSSWLS